MKKWNKIVIDNSNKITKIYNDKNFKEFSEDAEIGGYNSIENYSSKKNFFDFYLKNIYLTWHNYLKDNLNPEVKTLSIASGRGINELALISDNFDIVCSDLEIPQCYEESKKLFGDFHYNRFNVLTDNISDKFNNIFALSFFYIFSQSEIEKIFYKIHNILKKDGTFILDFGGCEDNLFSFFFNHIFLTVEAYFIYYLTKPFNKKIGLKIDHNFGYRWKNHEIIALANKIGSDGLTSTIIPDVLSTTHDIMPTRVTSTRQLLLGLEPQTIP